MHPIFIFAVLCMCQGLLRDNPSIFFCEKKTWGTCILYKSNKKKRKKTWLKWGLHSVPLSLSLYIYICIYIYTYHMTCNPQDSNPSCKATGKRNDPHASSVVFSTSSISRRMTPLSKSRWPLQASNLHPALPKHPWTVPHLRRQLVQSGMLQNVCQNVNTFGGQVPYQFSTIWQAKQWTYTASQGSQPFRKSLLKHFA